MPTSITWDLTPDPAPAPTPPDLATGYSAAAYARQLKELLPPGALWLLSLDSSISKTLEGLAVELARVDARSLDLLEEADPRTTTELLEDWERVLGLPDGCLPSLLTEVSDRRLNALRKYVQRGGQSRQFFIDLCAAMNAPITITEFFDLPFRSGTGRCGGRIASIDAVHTWRVNFTTGVRLAVPVISSVVNVSAVGGSLAPGTKSYRVAAFNDGGLGVTPASAAVAVVVPAGTMTNQTRVNWTKVPGATGYLVYGRTGGGAENLIAGVGDVDTWLDDGSAVEDVTPDGDPRTTNTAISEVGNALKCILNRAKPAHTVLLFAYD